MRPVLAYSVLALTILASPLAGQRPHSELEETIAAAQTSTDIEALLDGAEAALLLRDIETADALHDRSTRLFFQLINRAAVQHLQHALATGKGADGALRAFGDVRSLMSPPPATIANFANNFPVLLTGGTFDETILSVSMDAEDPDRRCACFAAKAWVHRQAGRPEIARIYWDSLVTARGTTVPTGIPANQRAQIMGQFSRDLARAGRVGDARLALEEAMAIPVNDDLRPLAMRRWAQTYAELGEPDNAVAILEQLLAMPSTVTVHTLEARPAWNPIRDSRAFQDLLARHR